MVSWRDELGSRAFWLHYYASALADPKVPAKNVRTGKSKEAIRSLEDRISGEELVVRLPKRYSLRFSFDRFAHFLSLAAPGRKRLELGNNDGGSAYPAAFRWEEFLTVVDAARPLVDGEPVDADKLALLLLMYVLPGTRKEAEAARRMLRDRLVSSGPFGRHAAADFARAAFPPDRFVPWTTRDGVWVVDHDCCSLRKGEGDPFDHSALGRFLEAMSSATRE